MLKSTVLLHQITCSFLVCFPPVWLSDTALIVFSCSPCKCSRVPLLFPCRRNILCCVASSSEKICYFGTLASIFFFVLFCLVVVLLVWLVVIVLVFLLSIWTLVPAGHSSAKILNKLVAFIWCFTQFKENTWSHLSWFKFLFVTSWELYMVSYQQNSG